MSESSRIRQTNSELCICILPSEVSLLLKIFPKNIFKIKRCEDEIDTVFNSPCLFTSATSKTWTRTLDPEEPGPWKTWKTAGYGKMIRRTYYNLLTLKIC